MRAFFALELGASARAATLVCIRNLRSAPGGDGVRWVEDQNLHVTLRFLGSIVESRIGDLVACVGEAIAGIVPFSLALGAVRGFPDARRPRVFIREVAPLAPLESLASVVECGAVAAGFAGEDRPFRPHLTLGRVRRSTSFPDVTAADTPVSDVFDVTEIVLFRSELHSSGSRYTALAQLPLAPVSP